jgi:hypothetical protein
MRNVWPPSVAWAAPAIQIRGIRPLREIQVQQRLLANLGTDTDISHQK